MLMKRIVFVLALAAAPAVGLAADDAGGMDLDAAAAKLGRAVGGSWAKRTIRIGERAVTVLEGRVLLGTDQVKGEWFRVYPFAFDRDGRKLLWQAPTEFNAPEYVAGTGPSATVLGLLGPTKVSRAVVEALGLRQVNVDGIALHHA